MRHTKHTAPKILSINMLLVAVMIFIGRESIAQGSANLVFNITTPRLALIDVEPSANNNINLEIAPSAEAGESTGTVPTNNSLWINYTCSKATSEPLKKINVQVNGMIPSGISLKLLAAQVVGAGKGQRGTVSGSSLILSTVPQTLITGIGGSYTGDGVGNGHQLTFSVDIADFNILNVVQNTTIQVIYTLADN
jgi:hypothetical protein